MAGLGGVWDRVLETGNGRGKDRTKDDGGLESTRSTKEIKKKSPNSIAECELRHFLQVIFAELEACFFLLLGGFLGRLAFTTCGNTGGMALGKKGKKEDLKRRRGLGGKFDGRSIGSVEQLGDFDNCGHNDV